MYFALVSSAADDEQTGASSGIATFNGLLTEKPTYGGIVNADMGEVILTYVFVRGMQFYTL